MDEQDKTMIMKLRSENFILSRLYSEHLEFEKKLSRLENRSFLLPQEEEEARKLKRKKLFGVDRMMQILKEHKEVSGQYSAL